MNGVWIAIALLGGLALGGLVGWLLARQRGNAAERAAAVANEKATALQERLTAVDAERRDLAERVSTSMAEVAEVRTRLAAVDVDLLEERERFKKSQEQLRDAFANLSSEALKKNADSFLQLAKERFEAIQAEAKGDLGKRQKAIDAQISPLKEALEQYRKHLGEIEEKRTKAYADVKEELGKVGETQRVLGAQTNQLVTALRRPGTRGQWGELTLRRLLELAGMANNFAFTEQSHEAGEDGAQRPDLVVNLPGNRSIVVDSKYAADDFLKAAECEDPQKQREHLRAFAKAVRGHATKLGLKSYWTNFDNTPEYVVMFLPGEALIYAAAEADPSIIEDAFQKNVIIATPTTLVALLKTIAAGWREAEVEANIEKVKTLGTSLLDRMNVFVDHLSNVGKSLDSSVQNYNKAIGSLDSRLLPACREMHDLGTESKSKIADVPRIDTATRNVPEIVRGGIE
jgi:DNA recombination protein RmuC